MNRKLAAVMGICVVLVFGYVVATMDWNSTAVNYGDEVPENAIQFYPDANGELGENSLQKVLFEQYGAILLVIGTLMFGALIAGVCISREEEDK